MHRIDYLRAVGAFRSKHQALPEPGGGSGAPVTLSLRPPETDRRPIWFEELRALAGQPGAENISNIVVHGSFGDGTAVSYSDLDLTVVVDKGATSEKQVRAVNQWIDSKLFPFLVKVDPLQHHGPFLLWPGLCQSYSELVLPLASYDSERAWSVEPLDLMISLNDAEPCPFSSVDCAERLANASQTFFRYGFDLYSAKRFISNATLLPAYFMGDIGHPTDKATSFDLFYEHIGFEPELVLAAEKARSDWQGVSPMISKLARLSAKSTVGYRAVHMLDRGRSLSDSIAQMQSHAATLVPLLRSAIETSQRRT